MTTAGDLWWVAEHLAVIRAPRAPDAGDDPAPVDRGPPLADGRARRLPCRLTGRGSGPDRRVARAPLDAATDRRILPAMIPRTG